MNLKSSSPLLTAVMPVKELKIHYPRFSEWVRKLTTNDLSIVVVNDGQLLETDEILFALQREMPDGILKVLRGENKGPGSARNIGLAHVESPWVCFWDVDDLPHVNEIMAELKAIQAKEVDIVIGAFTKIDILKNTEIREKMFGLDHKQNLSQIAFEPGLWRFCFKTESLKDIRFPEIYMGEDQVFIAKCNVESKKVVFTNKIFYNYVKGVSGQLTNSKSHIKDLGLAIEFVSNILITRPESNTTKIQTMRLIVSGLLRGNFLTKINSFTWLMRAIIVNQRLSLRDLVTLLELLKMNK